LRDNLNPGPALAILLTIDAALARVSAGVAENGNIAYQLIIDGGRGQAARLATMVAEVLASAKIPPDRLDAVAVTVGPGSFTGLRTALSLAHGIARGLEKPVIGVTLSEAFAKEGCVRTGRVMWTAIDTRRGRVFLDFGDGFRAWSLDSLPMPGTPVCVVGDAAVLVAAQLAARGADVLLADARLPTPSAIARAAEVRLGGSSPGLSQQPLYIDGPEARLPGLGLRPAPIA
jgi:tRNA threonylcarbamoyladenosine biosynthesis protein TsaB